MSSSLKCREQMHMYRDVSVFLFKARQSHILRYSFKSLVFGKCMCTAPPQRSSRSLWGDRCSGLGKESVGDEVNWWYSVLIFLVSSYIPIAQTVQPIIIRYEGKPTRIKQKIILAKTTKPKITGSMTPKEKRLQFVFLRFMGAIPWRSSG